MIESIDRRARASHLRMLFPAAGFTQLRQRLGRDRDHVAAVRAHVDEDIGDDESRARELDGSQRKARADEFVATAAGIGDVIADFGMCKHGFFSATGRATRVRVVGFPYGQACREDSTSQRYT